jgi:hypothetical protein
MNGTLKYKPPVLFVIIFCLALFQSGCVYLGKVQVKPPIGDQGSVITPDNINNNIVVDSGLSKSSLSMGSVFLYDNPVERWKITAMDKQNIAWRNDSGGTKLTALSTLFPTLRWHGYKESGRRIISGISGSFYPLKKGNKVTFKEEVMTARPPDLYHGYWECEVQDEIKITVPAGSYDTWQILCMLNGREHLLLNYAETLANNVRTIQATEDNNKPIVRQLMAVSLAASKDNASASEIEK